MFRNIIFASCLVGLIAGVVITGLQLALTVPVILEAETYEGGGHAHDEGATASEEATSQSATTESTGFFSGLYQRIYTFQHAESDWEPEEGLQRSGATLIANVLIAMAFSMLLIAAISLRPDARWTEGLLWGLAGYASFYALPALGLPPEIPGTFAADLVPRQGWWLLTVVCSGIGLAMIALQRQWAWKIVGALLVVAPHLIGAPHPEVHGGTAPAELADAFIWRTAIVNLVSWLLIGGLGAWMFDRLARGSASRVVAANLR